LETLQAYPLKKHPKKISTLIGLLA